MTMKTVTITVPKWVAEYWLEGSQGELEHWQRIEGHHVSGEDDKAEAKKFQDDWIITQAALKDGLKKRK